MPTTRVFAKLKSKPGNEAAIRNALQVLVTATLQEPGVVFYELFETLEGGEFLVNEEYRDEAAFGAHMASEHLQHAVAVCTPLMSGGLRLWKTKRVA